MSTERFTGKDDVAFEVTCEMLEPVAAYQLLARIGKVLLPAATAAQTGGARAALRSVFDDITPELALSVMNDALATTRVVRPDAKGELEKVELTSVKNINRAFRGNLKVLLQTIKFALETNYGDFFAVSVPAHASEASTLSL